MQSIIAPKLNQKTKNRNGFRSIELNSRMKDYNCTCDDNSNIRKQWTILNSNNNLLKERNKNERKKTKTIQKCELSQG